MERDRKKRKMENEEEGEEEKMEKLYTLLKNAREMRKNMISSMEKKRQEEERARVRRFPAFQPEDFIFMNKAEAKNTENAADSSSSASNKYVSKEKQEESETNICLELNLSL